jgi:hypothetical protein
MSCGPTGLVHRLCGVLLSLQLQALQGQADFCAAKHGFNLYIMRLALPFHVMHDITVKLQVALPCPALQYYLGYSISRGSPYMQCSTTMVELCYYEWSCQYVTGRQMAAVSKPVVGCRGSTIISSA